MIQNNISIDQFVKQQVKKWEDQFSGRKDKSAADIPVITVAMEPGSGGSIIAEKIAGRLKFDYFHRGIVEKIAKTAKIRGAVVNSLRCRSFRCPTEPGKPQPFKC